MRLLFDQNLSPRLPARLADLFPGSEHVEAAGLGTATDETVWAYALAGGLAVVSKDEDCATSASCAAVRPRCFGC